MALLDIDRLLLRVVLDDKLLQVQESTLVVYLLSQLHDGLPCVSCVGALAVLALLVADNELDHKLLLQLRVVQDLCTATMVVRTHPRRGQDMLSADTHAHTSFCTVMVTFSRLECGSVHRNSAFTRRTLCKPLTFFMQTANSCGDSGAATTQDALRLYLEGIIAAWPRVSPRQQAFVQHRIGTRTAGSRGTGAGSLPWKYPL